MTQLETSADLGLAGRVVLVTGAGRGLGRTYAAALAHQSAQVVVHDAGVDQDGLNPDPAVAAQVAEEIRAEGGSALAVTDVLRDAASCRRVVAAALEHFGRLDGLIHNAGLVVWRDPAEVDEELFARLSDVNTDAAFWLCSAALPVLRARGFGRIVLTTSGWAFVPSGGSDQLVLYSHGKGAQFGLAMALAKGAGHPDILTNLIAPVANTRMLSAEVRPDQLRPESYQRSWLFTYLTAFLCPLVRRGLRRGARPPQAARNAASGQRNAASGGPQWLPGCVAMLARCAKASRFTPRLPRKPLRPIKWVNSHDLWY